MIDRKALFGGLALVAAIPLLMLWQSGNTSRGTSRGWSEYNVEIFVSKLIVEHLNFGDAEALNEFCILTLSRGASPAYVGSWIDRTADKCGECADVRVARGRLCGAVGDTDGMRREFAAAFAAAKNGEERERVRRMIGAPR